ncbi:hypothetical protein LOTGIDRAFT_123506 [Lottia gigantea]|uniref:Glomulin n=1 Tax=Lottia gigantea TaxID=225164 RepID=V4A5T5_LOTGI|nr:hypothetical protein LOTGIDRAFT_123506 [Lottia gigantea]ESO90335.1 hypothetical protein LOTGIDRAFT_123506 [Lottia gigantea]
MYIVTEGSAKEMLLALLEQCEFHDNDVKFTMLISFIQKTLLRLPNKRFHSLDLALETLTSHIMSLPVPEDNALENQERKLLAMCPEVSRINQLLDIFLNFLRPFIEEVSLKTSTSLNNDNVQAQIIVLKIHLLKILDHPVIYLDLDFELEDRSVKNTSRVIVEKLMELFTHLETDFQKMMEYANKNKAKVPSLRFNEIIPVHSLCCLSYLVHSEKLGVERFPCIYSNLYVFEFNLPFINVLLKCTRSLLIIKGLKLLESFLQLISCDTLSYIRLDNDHYSNIVKNLIDVMVRCSVKDIRQDAVKIFASFIRIFQSDGRYQIYQNILNTCKHSGVNGFVIKLIKDDIKDALMEKNPDKLFLGRRLERLLRLAVILPEGETTDLLEHSDRIITVLNLFRYLVIRDPPKENKTGIWDNLKEMETRFFKPLRVGLDMSKAHYDLELKKIIEGKQRTKRDTTDFEVSVGGASLPQMSEKEEMFVVKSALNTFDLIDSLLKRLSEIIDQQKL